MRQASSKLALCAAAVLATCAAFAPRGAPQTTRIATPLHAGFGAATEKKKKSFVKPGKKDLEKQWENFFVFQSKGANLLRCESVWARAGGDGAAWLRVGSVVTKADDVTNGAAVAAQKPLIAWTAAELHPTLQAAKAPLEFGLGPYVDDDKDDDGEPDVSKVVATAAKAGGAKAKDVSFKPVRSPLPEHQTSLAGALLNKSVGKGSAKFKGGGGAAATADSAKEGGMKGGYL